MGSALPGEGLLAPRRNILKARRVCSGFSLIEVALLSILLLVAVGGLSGAVLSSLQLARSTEESARADDAARALLARLQVTPFADVFASYNSDPQDDPGGPGRALGAAFDVPGLTPRRDDPDGRVGRIVFPSIVTSGTTEELREDLVDARLGRDELLGGRDLNGDGDALDVVNDDYRILPVKILVEWRGSSGQRSFELDAVLLP